MPAFHCVDDGSGLSYSYTRQRRGRLGRQAARPSVCNWPKRSVTDRRDGRIEHLREDGVPDGRSKYSPPPPRSTIRCRPVRSYAMPNRGATPSAGLKVGRDRECPGRPGPDRWSVLPLFGTMVPIASVVFGPRNWPVSGFIA